MKHKIVIAAVFWAFGCLAQNPIEFATIPSAPTAVDKIILEYKDGVTSCLEVFLAGREINFFAKEIRVAFGVDTNFSPCPGGRTSLRFELGRLDPMDEPFHDNRAVGMWTVKFYESFFPFEKIFSEENLIQDNYFEIVPYNPTQIGFAQHESPRQGEVHSGIGLIRGWVCNAKRIEIAIDGGNRIDMAYGTTREDTKTVCGDVAGEANNGYGVTFNWGLLGAGIHRLQAFADDIEFTDVEFEVVTIGGEFVKDLEGRFLLEGFPAPDESVEVEWRTSSQDFNIIEHYP